MTSSEIEKEVAALNWWQRIELGFGIITPGVADTALTLTGINLPKDFSGKTVLDVGAYNGFYSFEVERRGAKRVLAIDVDHLAWKDKRPFDLACKVLNSKVESKILSVYDLSPQNEGIFDVTLFLGVFYHLRYPLLALEKIFNVTREMIILESHIRGFEGNFDKNVPLMTFYANGRSGDKVNYNEPNLPMLKEMLIDVGFTKLEDFGGNYLGSRVAIHAWK